MANNSPNILVLFILIQAIVAGSLAEPVATTDGTNTNTSEPSLVLLRLQLLVQEELDLLDENVSLASESLAVTGLVGPETREVLNAVCQENPSVITCSAVDLDGIMVTVEPEAYRWAEGSNISDQKHVIEIHEAHQPVLSTTFPAVEGFNAVVLEWPIFSPGGEMIGSVNALFRPDLLLNSTAERWRQEVEDQNLSAWAMATDGLILYDPDPEEVGRNLFSDPLYEPYVQLLALGERIASEKSGNGAYEFLGPGLVDPVVKSTSWTTVGLHGTEWRLVVAHVV
jgi:hypothetical protein